MAATTQNNKSSSAFEKFILHLHPYKIDRRAIKVSRTFGLGGINALLFVILVFTGMILRFSYVPTAQNAYDSIVHLQRETALGGFIRNVHHITAVLMVVVSFLHLLRVFYSQAIYGKRAQNWVFGLLLFFLVVGSNFTGYLLPWDQLSYWAVTVVSNMLEYIPLVGKSFASIIRSGDSVNGNTLLNFYNLHTGILPILFLLLMSFHFWLVRRAGGVALPKVEKIEKVTVMPHLVIKELLALTIILAGIFLLAVFYEAPLLTEANPLVSPNPAKAPWYFLGAQELLLHVHPVFGAFVIPLFVTAFLFFIPYIPGEEINTGVWFNTDKGKKCVLQAIVVSTLFTFILIWLLEHVVHFEVWLPSVPGWVSNGIFPLLFYLLPIGAYLKWLNVKMGCNKTELVLAGTTILFTSYIIMMCISLFLRGEGMRLIF